MQIQQAIMANATTGDLTKLTASDNKAIVEIHLNDPDIILNPANTFSEMSDLEDLSESWAKVVRMSAIKALKNALLIY